MCPSRVGPGRAPRTHVPSQGPGGRSAAVSHHAAPDPTRAPGWHGNRLSCLRHRDERHLQRRIHEHTRRCDTPRTCLAPDLHRASCPARRTGNFETAATCPDRDFPSSRKVVLTPRQGLGGNPRHGQSHLARHLLGPWLPGSGEAEDASPEQRGLIGRSWAGKQLKGDSDGLLTCVHHAPQLAGAGGPFETGAVHLRHLQLQQPLGDGRPQLGVAREEHLARP